MAYVESTSGGTVQVSDFNGLRTGAYLGSHPASRVFRAGTMPDHYIHFPKHNQVRVPANTVIRVSDTGASYFYDAQKVLHWIPDPETYYCLLARGKTVTVVPRQSQVDALGNGKPWVTPCFAPARVVGHIVRESNSGSSYYVTTGGPLASGGTLWHWIPDAQTYNCLVSSGVAVIQSNWTQIKSLRGSGRQNEGPQAICATHSGPAIISVTDLIIAPNDTGSHPVRLDYRDDDCDVAGGTWIDQSGVAHDFGNADGTDSGHPRGCSGGAGYLTPGYGSCAGPDGQRGKPGRYAQTITIRDALGNVSAPFVFYIVCQ